MNSSRLQLNEFFITKLDIEYVQGSEESNDSTEYNLSMDYDVSQHVEDEHYFKLEFMVKIKPKRGDAGLSVIAGITGLFSFPEGVEESEMQYLVRVNGCTILYGLLRGQVAMISGSFPCGKVTIPAIVMQDKIKQIEEKKNKKK